MRIVFPVFGLALFLAAANGQPPPRYGVGITILGSNGSCKDAPVFIGGVTEKSPAASAGLEPGDRLIAINGVRVSNFQDAARRTSSPVPGPVTLTVRRGDEAKTVSVPREKLDVIWSRIGLTMLDNGMLVGTGYTDAEIAELRRLPQELDQARKAGDFVNIFPGHYPADKRLYYPGFELFVWDHGQQVRVGGIENGPAKNAGVRWGDRVVSVDGQDPGDKSVSQLESLFSSRNPATMRLVINRAGRKISFTFSLARAADVLKANHWKIANGQMVPDWLPADLISCFD